MTLPITNHPLFIIVDSSLIGSDCALFEMNDKGKLDNTSYKSRVFTTSEQKLFTLYQE